MEWLPSIGIVNRVYRAALNGQTVVLRLPMPEDDSDALPESVAAPAALTRVSHSKKLGLADVATVARLLEGAPPLSPVFLHNDLHAGNLMVTNDGAVTVLIDWGDAGWGEPMLDLTYARALAAPELLRGYRSEEAGMDSGATLRLLAYLLEDAARRLAYAPEGHETDLWYTRPGTALMQLLRVSVQFPEWGEWLGHQG